MASNVKSEDNTAPNKPFSCDVCSFKTSTNVYLKRHKRKHGGFKPYECTLCDFKTIHKSSLAVHLRIHAGDKPFKCELCSYSTVKKGHLRSHFASMHKYKDCHKTLTSADELKNHTKIISPEQHFTCFLCGVKMRQKCHLKTHIINIHSGKRYECRICCFVTAQEPYLKSHMNSHFKEKYLKCNICEFSTANKGVLKFHIETIHAESKTFICDICKLVVNRKDHLAKHINSAHRKKIMDEEDKEFKCRSCYSKYVHERSLKRHMLICCPEKLKSYPIKDAKTRPSVKTSPIRVKLTNIGKT